MIEYNKLLRNFCLCVIIILLLFNIKTAAQQFPSLKVIAENFIKTTIPSKGYTVFINQSIETPNKSIALSKTLQLKSNFSAKFTPKRGFQVNKINKDNKKKSQQLNNKLTLNKQSNVKVTLDLSKIFKNYENWNNVKIVKDILGKNNYYKITAKNGAYSFTLWVDILKYYIPKIILNINNKRFSTTNIIYKSVGNKYWLPERMVIEHASDGTQITQNFGDYIF